MKFILLVFIILVSTLITTISAAGQFTLRYVGFAPTDEWRDASMHVVQILNRHVNARYDINIDMDVAAMDGGVLAFGRPAWTCAKPDNTNYIIPSALFTQMVGGTQCPMVSSTTHIAVTVNTQPEYPFYFGTDGMTPAGMEDFVTVVLHEVGHGLGFGLTGFITQDGRYQFAPRMSWYDYFVFSDYLVLPVAQYPLADADVLRRSTLFFRGTHPKVSIRLFVPALFMEGTSLAHTNGAGLMWYRIPRGMSIHCLEGALIDFLENFGYSVFRNQTVACVAYTSGAQELISFLF